MNIASGESSVKKQTYEYIVKNKYEGQPICSDPAAQPKENETGIHFSVGERTAWISTYEPAVVEGLLEHANFKVEKVILLKIKRKECVIGVVGRIPVGSLKIGKRRPTDRHDLIVSNR